MDNSNFFIIDGESFNDTHIIEFSPSYEILDGEETDRTQGEGWPMVRAPEGTIVNIDKITFGSTTSDNPDFGKLIRALASFGVYDFKTVQFMTPIGLISQDMYCAGKIATNMELIEMTVNGVEMTYWGSITTKFTARTAYYTPSNPGDL